MAFSASGLETGRELSNSVVLKVKNLRSKLLKNSRWAERDSEKRLVYFIQ